MAHATTTVLQNYVIEVLSRSTLPLSVKAITEELLRQQLVYSYRQVYRRVDELLSNGKIELVGRYGSLKLFSIPGQKLEPWQATSQGDDSSRPIITVRGYSYSPEQLAKQLSNTSWSLLSDSTNRELSAQLTLLTLGNSAYSVLKAHSILPVAHLRKPLEEINAKLKILSQLIETILNSELIKTGSSGNSITNQTRDSLLEELEPWLMELSTNLRSNINE